jgi:DNA-binding MarR family transcriptional regulator
MVSLMKYISVTSRCAIQYRSEKLSGSDLNGFQCTYILYICKNPGISQDQLARIIYINKSNVTRQLAMLEENGYVERRICETDKRVIEVFPTQKSLDILPRVKQVFDRWNDYITGDFTEEEKATLNSMLERMAKKAMHYTENVHPGKRA